MITDRIQLRLAGLTCVVASTLIMAGCTTSQISTAFTAFTDGVSVASVTATVLCGAGTIPAPVCAVLLPAISNAANAAPQCEADLESNAALAVQITECVTLLAPLVGQTIPGLTAEAQAILAGVGEVAKVLISALQSLLPAATAADKIAAKTATTAHVSLTYGDRRAISDGVTKAKQAVTRIQSYQASHQVH